ncbi:MAG: hypothetical protein ACM3TU_03190 [Bacillota bacterium]
MRNPTIGAHRGSTREAKKIYSHRISTIEDKLKRHRRKARIWRRAVRRLATDVMLAASEPSIA